MTETFTGLILAAPRFPGVNPLSMIEDVSHKCLVKANGVPMLKRVVDSLLGAEHVGRILISIDDVAVIDQIPELAALRAQGRIEAVTSRDNLFASIAGAVEEAGEPYPLLITTADNALQTPEIVDHFLGEVRAAAADVGFAMAPHTVIMTAYPETTVDSLQLHTLRDGLYTTCNLYAITNADAMKVAKVMKGGGQFRRRNWRVLKAFGLINLIRYRYRFLSLEGIARAASRRFGLKVVAVSMPFADSAVDADKEASFNFIERALKQREGAAAPAP